MILIIYLLIRQIQSILRLKRNHFRQFWPYIDLGIIICSCLVVVTYVRQYREASRVGDLFQQTNGFFYINLQRSAYISDLQNACLAFSCFFACLNILRLAQYHRRLRLFTDTLRQAREDLLSFTTMFSVLFIAFLFLFYFIFLATVSSCATLLETASMLFQMILMKFDARQLVDAHPYLGPLSFTLFILVVVFICMNMFVTIISQSFRCARDAIELQSRDDSHLLTYTFRKCQRYLGRVKARAALCISRKLVQVCDDGGNRAHFLTTMSECVRCTLILSSIFLKRSINCCSP